MQSQNKDESLSTLKWELPVLHTSYSKHRTRVLLEGRDLLSRGVCSTLKIKGNKKLPNFNTTCNCSIQNSDKLSPITMELSPTLTEYCGKQAFRCSKSRKVSLKFSVRIWFGILNKNKYQNDKKLPMVTNNDYTMPSSYENTVNGYRETVGENQTWDM